MARSTDWLEGHLYSDASNSTRSVASGISPVQGSVFARASEDRLRVGVAAEIRLYFYNPAGRVSEPLFSAMMKDVIGIEPSSKDEGLREFASRGFLLIDATNTPVNHDHLSLQERNKAILNDLPILVEELREYVGPQAGIVLVKANVCTLLEPILTAHGFPILNCGRTIPFPSNGQQNRFRGAVRQVLGLGSRPEV